MMNNFYTVGWDIGGAHVKAAVSNSSGVMIAVFQQPCPLWQGLEQLQSAVQVIMQRLPKHNYRHAITMTGELVDLFSSREQGVAEIIDTMQILLMGQRIDIFAGTQGLVPIDEITSEHYQTIASSNWLASAYYVAQKLSDGVFIDIGSTTTDILLLHEGNVAAQGYTDYQRLISQELVYTGIIRTPVMAVAQHASDQGKIVGIMAEYFATMADVYRLTGELNEAHDQTPTADGALKSVAASGRRLARMIGCDFNIEELTRWQAFADNIRSQQLQKIQQAYQQLLAKSPLLKDTPIIGAGVGRFLVKSLAATMQQPYIDFTDLCPSTLTDAELELADCAPAVALALLR